MHFSLFLPVRDVTVFSSHKSDEDEKEDQKETSVHDGIEAEFKEGLHKNETYSCSSAHSSNLLVFHTYSLPFLESF